MLDVFEMMDSVRRGTENARRVGQDVNLVCSIEAVLDVLLDADVTYGIIGEDEPVTVTPMMTERDAIVRALYTGKHVSRRAALSDSKEDEMSDSTGGSSG